MRNKLDKMIDEVLDEINDRFSQVNMPKCYIPYDICNGVVIFYGCGGVYLKDRFFYWFTEDDGHWFKTNSSYMSSAWLPSIIKCLETANNYLCENGKPYNYANSDILCGYQL